MWLITPIGFFSIVQKPGDKKTGTLTIRARVRGDLTALKLHYLPGLGPIKESSDTDYRFRATAPRTEVSAAMARLVDGLDYSNFKSEVAKRQGHARSALYHDVWSVIYKLQTDPVFADKAPSADSYGGVVVSGGKRVLLREPTKHHGGYAWTFAKTEAKPGESPRDAAIRAVREKTGYDATIRISVPGLFKGTASSTTYYVMDAKHPPTKAGWQTASMRWVRFDEARELIRQTPNAEGRDRDLAILEAAEKSVAAIPYKEHARVQPEDWNELHEMPPRHTVLYPRLSYKAEEMDKIQRGFFPTVMEQKWFLYFTGDRLRMHRSWTGLLICDVGFVFDSTGGASVTDVIVNRVPDQYGNTDDRKDLKLVEGLIRDLLQPLDEPEVDGFVKAMMMASKPNYLGSPEVVHDALTPLFAAKVGWWSHLHDNSMPAVSPSEVDAQVQRITRIFSGDDPAYTTMPWHSVDQLGQSAIARFNLNVEYCAGESMQFVMLESAAAISLAIGRLLDGYIQDKTDHWPAAIQQLHRLQEFVETVLLGTASVLHPDQTLLDYRWQPVIIEDEEDEEMPVALDPYTHPSPNEEGNTVHIKHPHTPTSPDTWDAARAIATFVPGGDCPDELNGIPFESWFDHPEGEDWAEVEGQLEELEEPPMQLKLGLVPASGVVIEECDGRVWVVSPTNGYGGYRNSFPKGKEETDEVSWQANAIKEAYEESGLQVRIVDLIGDVERTTTVTRYYRAVRVGGMPVDMGCESQAVHLVPIGKLGDFLDSQYDQKVIALAYGIKKQVKKT